MAGNLKLQVVLDAIDRATGPLKKISKGSKGAGQALRETRDRLRTLENAQKDLKGFANLKRSSEATAAAMSDQQRKIQELTRQINTTTGSTKRLTQSKNKAIRQAQKLKTQYEKEQSELRRLRGRMREVDGITGSLSSRQRQLAQQIERTTKRLEGQKRAMDRLGKARVGERLNNARQAAGRFSRQVAVATTVAVGGIFTLAKSTADLGDNVAKTADKIGIGIEPLQELRFAAERSGVSTEKLDSSLERFIKRTGEATQGTGAARKAFDELGLSADQLSQLSPDAALGRVADRLATVDNQTQRVALAAQLFGREGVAMVNMLKNGSAGLAELRQQGRLAGNVLSEQTARAAEKFTDRLQITTSIIGGMKNALGSALMPVVNRVMGRFNKWALSNRDAIDKFAKRFAKGLEDALPSLIELAKSLGSTLGLLGSATATLARMVGGFDNLSIAFGVFLALKPIVAIGSLVLALSRAGAALFSLLGTLPVVGAGFSAVGAAIAATPIGFIIAGVAAVAGAAFLLIKNWDKVSEFFSNLWPNIKDAFSGGIEAINKTISSWSPLALFRAGFDSVVKFFSVDLPNSFTEFGGQILSGFVDGASRRFRTVTRFFGGLWDRIKGAFSGGLAGVSKLILDWSPLNLFFKAFSGALSFFGVDLPSRFTDFGGQLIQGFVSGASRRLGTITRFFGGIWNRIKEAFSGGIVGISKLILDWSPLNLFFKGFSGVLSFFGVDLPSSFTEFGGQILSGFVDGILGGLGKAKDAVLGAGDAVIGWFKGKLGINSPSRVFAQFGSDTLEGYRQGLERAEQRPLRQMDSLVRRISRAGSGVALGSALTLGAAAQIPQVAQPAANLSRLAPPASQLEQADGGSLRLDNSAPLPAPQSGGLTIQGGINITVQPAPGMDEQALAQMVGREVERALAQAANRSAARQRSAFHDID